MSERQKPPISDFFDDIAAQIMTASDAELRAMMEDAGLDPKAESRRVQSVLDFAVQVHNQSQIDDLPHTVPDDPGAMRELLDRLLAFPGSPSLAYREKTGSSEHDLRVLTENLLELIKKRE